VHQHGVQDECDSESYVPALGGVSPNKELKAMRAILVGVFELVESEFLLHVESAVVPVKQQVVHRRHSKYTA
jgi:hypothetical protein